MQLEIKKTSYTTEEYLELEEKAEFRSEYRDGEILPITGGTNNHNKITLNLAASLKITFKGQTILDFGFWILDYLHK